MPQKEQSNSGFLRLIAVFKFFKAASLIVLGVAALKLVGTHDAPDALTHFIARLGLAPGHRYLDEALNKLSSLPPNKFEEIGIGSFFYAALFLTEGTGLWLLKSWAEYFTTIITASLVPVEIYELIHHPTAAKAVVLLLNLAIVVYLILRIRKERAEAH